jgi:hypothetical protein
MNPLSPHLRVGVVGVVVHSGSGYQLLYVVRYSGGYVGSDIRAVTHATFLVACSEKLPQSAIARLWPCVARACAPAGCVQ